MDRGFIERMPDIAFRLMSATMALEDWLHPTIDKRVVAFGIREGMTVELIHNWDLFPNLGIRGASPTATCCDSRSLSIRSSSYSALIEMRQLARCSIWQTARRQTPRKAVARRAFPCYS